MNPEDPLEFFVGAVSVLYLFSRLNANYRDFLAHRLHHEFRECVNGSRCIGTDVERLARCHRYLHGASDMRGDIGNVRVGARLLAIAEDAQRLTLHDVIHEDAYDIPIPVADVLSFAINIVRPKNGVIQAKDVFGDSKFLLHGVFRNAVGIFRHRRESLVHR